MSYDYILRDSYHCSYPLSIFLEGNRMFENYQISQLFTAQKRLLKLTLIEITLIKNLKQNKKNYADIIFTFIIFIVSYDQEYLNRSY